MVFSSEGKSWTGTFYYKNYFSFLRSANDRFLREKSQIIWQGWDKETRRECFPLSSSSIKGNSPWIHSFHSWMSLSTHKNGDRYNDDDWDHRGNCWAIKEIERNVTKPRKLDFFAWTIQRFSINSRKSNNFRKLFQQKLKLNFPIELSFLKVTKVTQDFVNNHCQQGL